MTSGKIAKWHVKEGDKVEAGDLLLEVATDKATIEYDAFDEGFVAKIIASEGEEVEVNQPIAIMTQEEGESIEGFAFEEKKEERTQSKKEQEQPQPEKGEKKAAVREPGQRIKASPLAKKLAKQRGIDLATLKGSGPGGRIMKRDLERAEPTEDAAQGIKEVPLSQMRKVIAQRLQEAKATIPHFYVSQDIDVERLLRSKAQMDAGELRISINDFVLRAAALALREHPVVNSGFDPKRSVVLQYESVDLSVAVTLPEGLITPIVKNADKKGLKEISREVKGLVKKAKEGKLQLEEFQGGSFTVSNMGMFGVSDFSAIINPPQCAILAVSGIQDLPIVKEGSVVAGKVMRLTLSADHRVIDGVAAATFMQTLKKLLESPALLVV